MKSTPVKGDGKSFTETAGSMTRPSEAHTATTAQAAGGGAESASWYHSGYVVVTGATPNRTRTADCHFLSELRIGGAKCVVMTPDYSESAKYADLWVPVKPGSDTAIWMGINHVILKEFYVDRQVPYFIT